ncbi:copper amine oxidase N-terminal domain-containing protein [Sedimentibacter saalensis]|uniref:copper amine oxidase N-terminal domain-containing protein n=1 Tax=Sedimentibacter saalensis TaxID=130788 RepID=UPI00289E4669|nr:copper amine oxidase N-terminal domain-containing protein [Sedimentibacter saalensis]
MNLKRILSMLIVTALLFSGISVYAAESTSGSTASPAVNEERLPMSMQYTGDVTKIIKDNEIVTALVITEGNDKITTRRFNISDSTVAIDNESGTAESLSTIKVGDKVSVIASSMSTFSIPPQSPAYVILTNIQEKAPAKLIQVGEIGKKTDGTMTVLDTDNNYIVSITKDTVLAPYRTKQIVVPEDIQKENYVLVWSEIMTLSIPAQMTADMVVLLTGYDFGKIPMPAQPALNITNYHTFQSSEGETMLPVRNIAEAMGFEVKWLNETKTVELKKESVTFYMNIGSKTYGNRGQKQDLKSAPEINNNRTYIPAIFFTEIMGVTLQ